ncbi:hypothetical protein [Georgenia wutianyii]|uniref:hypothetical protein n=1 Tax=Georgenia wutianyii TaxID=2585135 RepID=UPI0015D2ADFA|nr:hypothetical protein [Georgenia wutianyii]
MRVQLEQVTKGQRQDALPVTDLSFETGHATLEIAETEQRPTVLGLLASGRMRQESGSVLIDGKRDRRSLRRRVALVDAPDVSAPEPNVSVTGVVAEELMFARWRSGPASARRWLREQGLGDTVRLPMSNLEPAARVRILCELALLRNGVEGIVLVSPDRHGGDPHAWWDIAIEIAERDIAVLVLAGIASRTVLFTPRPPAARLPEPDRSTSHEGRHAATAQLQTPDGEPEPQPDRDAEPETDQHPEPERDAGPERDVQPEPDRDAEPDPDREPDVADGER